MSIKRYIFLECECYKNDKMAHRECIKCLTEIGPEACDETKTTVKHFVLESEYEKLLEERALLLAVKNAGECICNHSDDDPCLICRTRKAHDEWGKEYV